jgi:transposase
VDETSSRRGQFISVFFDAAERRLAFATPGRNAATFKRFGEDLQAHGGDPAAITDISMDMAGGFQAGAKAQCPQAAVSFDPFHVVQLGGRAMDEVRRAETKHEPGLNVARPIPTALFAKLFVARSDNFRRSFPTWYRTPRPVV